MGSSSVSFFCSTLALASLITVLAASAAPAQNVGIGTTTPAELLHVAGKTRTDQLQVTSGASTGYVLTSDVLGNATWQPAGGGGSGLPAGSANQTLRCVSGTTWAPTSDVVITSTGHVGIGTTSPSISYDLDIGNGGFRSVGANNVITGELGVSRTSAPSYDLHVDGDARFENIGVNTNPSTSYKLYVSGAVRFSSLPTGSGTAVVIDSSGNIRKQSSTLEHKEDVRDLEVDEDRLLDLRPVSFRWKPEHGGDEDVGLIAEEVAETMPELAWHEPAADGQGMVPAGVRYDKLGVYLIDVVAKQRDRIEELEARLARLEQALEAR